LKAQITELENGSKQQQVYNLLNITNNIEIYLQLKIYETIEALDSTIKTLEKGDIGKNFHNANITITFEIFRTGSN
jgi:hypothetical protein